MPLVSDNLYPSRLPPRIPLLPSFDSRSGSPAIDAKLVNGFMEKDQTGEWWVNKRPGLLVSGVDPVANGEGYGIWYWARVGNLYTITGDGLLRLNQTTTISTNMWAGNAKYTFNETLGTPAWLFMKTDIVAYALSSTGTFVEIVHGAPPDYPVFTVPGSAYLDGTLYVMTIDAKIYGSGLNDPTSWDALNVIVAQIEPDLAVALDKQASYVVAFKQWTTEFFYNAGAYSGAQTGSVLLPVQNAKLPMGCADAATIQSINDTLYFVGRNKTVGPGAYAIDRLKLSKFSTFAVDKVLAESTFGRAWQARQGGHTYYLLTIVSPTNMTLAFDIDSQIWYIWNENEGAVDVLFSTANLTSGRNLLQGTSGEVLRILDSFTYTDTTQAGNVMALPLDAITPIFDAGSNLGKVLSKLRIVADQNSGGSLQIRWSDNDYKDWTNWITINLQDDVPFLTNLGRFTKRAFQYRHISPAPFRMSAFEVDLLLCSI